MNSTQQVATILHDAYFFDPKNWSPGMNYPNLPQIINAIQRLFNQLNEQDIPYLLVGEIAMLNHVDGCNTKDVDLIIDNRDLAAVTDINILDENQDFMRASYGDVQLDLFLTQNQLFR